MYVYVIAVVTVGLHRTKSSKVKSQISKGENTLWVSVHWECHRSNIGFLQQHSLAYSLEYSARAMQPLLPHALTLGLCHRQDAELPTQTRSFHIRWEMCWELPIKTEWSSGLHPRSHPRDYGLEFRQVNSAYIYESYKESTFLSSGWVFFSPNST